MNSKMLLKLVLVILVLMLLVIMGMNNRDTAQLWMKPLLSKPVKAPSALMYFGFFAVGVLSCAILTGGKKGSGSSKSKSQK